MLWIDETIGHDAGLADPAHTGETNDTSLKRRHHHRPGSEHVPKPGVVVERVEGGGGEPDPVDTGKILLRGRPVIDHSLILDGSSGLNTGNSPKSVAFANLISPDLIEFAGSRIGSQN